VLTFDQIKELIELVSARRLQALEVERAGFRLRIEGQGGGAQPAAPAAVLLAPAASAAVPAAAPAAPAAEAGAAAAAGAGAAAAGPQDHVLVSPIVGTFYRAASPDAEPFVEVGSRVRKGQVLCIIEAMKLMNEIESDIDGVIAEIYPQNAQAVEFGEPLFAIRPA
jgi:acetyl-CoA carboxylase biotin carboxyl carrier protein